MQKIQDSYWFYLGLSFVAHSILLLSLFLTFDRDNSDTNLVQTMSGFSISSEESTGNTSENLSEENAGPGSKESDGSHNAEALFSQSIGNLKQSIPYPALAVSQEIQGTVIAFVRLEKGRLTELRIDQSSGFAVLDDQVKSSIRQWQWPEISASRRFSVRFRL
ncbi:MAG: hypothetical protein CMF59_19090 [Leptospiraceae bacterium]|nr:hypothetical protein [Leptospiraceae bacterium]